MNEYYRCNRSSAEASRYHEVYCKKVIHKIVSGGYLKTLFGDLEINLHAIEKLHPASTSETISNSIWNLEFN